MDWKLAEQQFPDMDGASSICFIWRFAQLLLQCDVCSISAYASDDLWNDLQWKQSKCPCLCYSIDPDGLLHRDVSILSEWSIDVIVSR